MQINDINKRIFEYFTKAKNANRLCFQSNCGKKAIDSHILQKNGVLSNISENKHLFKLHKDNYTGKVSFIKIGVNSAMTFKGFCSYHDSLLFKDIEFNSGIDYTNNRHLLLLNYRAILNEIRKKSGGGIKGGDAATCLLRRMAVF